LAKALELTLGRTVHDKIIVACTILRPGSGTVAKPLSCKAAKSVDVPPLEHPEIKTKRYVMKGLPCDQANR
jgi:hypothetical protein